MAPDVQDDEAIAARARALALTHAAHTAAFTQAPGASIRRTELARPSRKQRKSEAPAVRPQDESKLRMGKTLGSGGMGIVRAAEQVSLGRQVAVKSLQDSFQGEQATLMLLQEALVMGRLEHPNILPIHDLQFDEASVPRLVLKHIEGVEWGALMADAATVSAKFGEDDLLEWNVRVLMQVCNAIHFAHSRGIIHRDLKPPNVMIGSFGEVYVMDWGLALSMEEDEDGFLPLVEDARQLAGTPQYMAPEMLGDTHGQLGPLTDVYLLGAILYEIITDLPPHDGSSMEELIAAVLRSRPEFPPDAPDELVAICRQAMSAEPERRFASALELRRALQGFLEHAGSRRLEAQGRARAEELARRIAADDESGEDHAAQIQDLFAQCRFAYRQALEIWPDNLDAQRGLADLTTRMVDYEIEAGNARLASQLLTTLADPAPSLARRVEEALAEEEQAQARMRELERFRRKEDIQTGSRNRAFVAGLLGLSWTAAPLLGMALMPAVPEPGNIWPRVLPSGFAVGVLIVMGVVTRLGAEQVRESRRTQYLLGGMAIAMIALPALDLSGWLLGLPVHIVQALWPLTWFCVSAMLAIVVDMRMVPMTLGFLGALVASVVWPEQRYLAMTASNFVMTVNMFTIWMRPPAEGDIPLADGLRSLLKRDGDH